jgi:hypothetical protein
MLEVVDSCVRVLRVALGGGNSRWSVEVVEEWQSRASGVNSLNCSDKERMLVGDKA